MPCRRQSSAGKAIYFFLACNIAKVASIDAFAVFSSSNAARFFGDHSGRGAADKGFVGKLLFFAAISCIVLAKSFSLRAISGRHINVLSHVDKNFDAFGGEV